MGNICCCRVSEEADPKVSEIKWDSRNKTPSNLNESDTANTAAQPKVKANQKILLRSKLSMEELTKDVSSTVKIAKIQGLIRGFLVRNRVFKAQEKQEKQSIVSNSFVSHHLNNSENYYTSIGERVIQVNDPKALPENFLDNQRRMFNQLELKVGNKKYEGEWLNGKRDGFGILTWEDGSVFKGYFINDMSNGLGLQLHKSGETYFGRWVNDKADGLGYFKNNNNSRYEGEWRADKQNGFGRQIQIKGSVYNGEFLNGMKQGKGILELEDGSTYHGDFLKNEITGTGEFKYYDGKTYRGEWRSNRMHGFGILVYTDKKYFEGSFIDDKKEGFGIFKNGDKIYFGIFSNDKLNGEVLIVENNNFKNSSWKDGKKAEYINSESKFLKIAKMYLSNKE